MRDILLSWRAAIQAELATAKAELETAIKGVAEAEEQVRVAKVARSALSAAVSRLGTLPTLSGSLSWRVAEFDGELGQVAGKLLRAQNNRKSCLARIQDAESALEQLDRMAPPAEPEAQAA